MKKTTLFQRVAGIAGLAALAVLCLTCENGLQIQERRGKAAVSFTVTDGAARTALPQASLEAVTRYALLGGKDGAEETVLAEFTGTETSVPLVPGTWNFTLNAYNSSGAPILQGRVQNKQISLAGPNQVSFSLSPVYGGAGSVRITLNYPETAGITKITAKIEGGTEEYFTPATGGNFEYAKDNVAAGDYVISFGLYGGDKLRVTVSELVLVRKNLTSSKTITLVGEDLWEDLWEVAITSLKVGGKEVANLPVVGSTWRTATLGACVLFQNLVSEQPNEGIEIEAEAQGGATIQYTKAKPGVEPTSWSDNTKIKFEDDDLLYLKVTGAKAVGYYKVEICFKRSGRIKYGSPKIGYGTSADNVTAPKKTTEGAEDDGLPEVAGTPGYIDPLWNDPELEVYPIDRIYGADSTWMLNDTTGKYIDENGKSRTVATAKALWDEEGLSIFLKVIDSDVTAVDPGNHACDSFELFVNEGYPSTSYSNGGSQYRVGAGGRRSGEGGWNVLRDLNKTAAWKATQAVDGFDGYYVLLKAPWRLRDKFFSSTSYRNGWEFGFELSLNVGPEGTDRYGVQTWNNILHANYQNAIDYGVATLIGGPTVLNYPPLPPTITTHPKGNVKKPGDAVTLTVGASSADNGPLTYQWYSAINPTAAGNAISGATSASYTFSAPAEETNYYYYVVVTNTLNGKTATTTSARARIIVSSVPLIEQFSLLQSNVVYKFTLPAGTTFGDYNAISIKVKVDAAQLDKTVRSLRLFGNYTEDKFRNNNGYLHFAFEAANASYIYDDLQLSNRRLGDINNNYYQVNEQVNGGAPIVADQWFTITYRLVGNNPNGSFTTSNNKPADTDTGPFLFGVGVPGTNNGNMMGSESSITQLIKDVTMVHKTDPAKNVVTTDFFGVVGYTGASGFNYFREDLVPDPGY